jgi:hypothetical protein
VLKKFKRDMVEITATPPAMVPTVTVCFTGLRFNISASVQYLQGYKWMELFYSGEGKGFGVKLLTKPTEDSFEIKRYYQYGKLYSSRVYCTSFVKKLGVISGRDQRDKIFPVKLDEKKEILKVEFETHYSGG